MWTAQRRPLAGACASGGGSPSCPVIPPCPPFHIPSRTKQRAPRPCSHRLRAENGGCCYRKSPPSSPSELQCDNQMFDCRSKRARRPSGSTEQRDGTDIDGKSVLSPSTLYSPHKHTRGTRVNPLSPIISRFVRRDRALERAVVLG